MTAAAAPPSSDEPPSDEPARWHPPRPVLELLELVLTGALPELPATLALVGADDLGGLARRADPAHPAAVPLGLPVVVEDAEGTPVVRIGPGLTLTAERVFTAPPLRAHRRAPGDLAAARVPGGPAPVVVVVTAAPSQSDVAACLREASAAGRGLLLLAVVGAGRGPLSAEGLWRATGALADRARAAGAPADVVPVVVPRLPLGTGPDDGDLLVDVVAARYAGAVAGTVLRLPPATPGEEVPAPFAREVERAVPSPARRGVTVFFTGLSGSGKSTLAKVLAARLVEDGRRTVTLLDGDEVRRLLSGGLGFSRADRDLNIRRIGFVAAEVTRHGGLAICAPIAPFADVRGWVRQVVEAVGDLVLVHVATPLAECERRDRKGLYARARRGEIPDFTGISSPYEVPDDADLTVDTTGRAIDDCLDEVWALLTRRGYLA